MGDFYSDSIQYRGNKLFRLSSNKMRATVSTVGLLDNGVVKLNNSLVFARPLESTSSLKFSPNNDLVNEVVNINQSSVLASMDSMKIKVTGNWAFEEISMPQVAILVSFLDYQANRCRIIRSKTKDYSDTSVIMQTERFYISNLSCNANCFVALLISSKLRPVDYGIESFLSFIRKIENYWISHFLLSQLFNEDKDSGTDRLYNASKSYGVSESYFRKLCHNTFTRGPKKQLRIWRASHSALQLIEKDKSIATIAGNNGYASSSHFSSEIKSIFGIRPREFRDLEVFFNE